MLSFIIDVTERRCTDELFRLAIEAAPSGMILVDSHGKIVLINSQTEKLFDYPRAELIGKPIEVLVPARFRDTHHQLREEFFARPESRPMGAGRDLYGLRRDDTEFPVEIGLSTIETEQGTFTLSAIVDITERRRLLEWLQQSQKMESLGQLASGVAHDFNNLLSVILGCFDLLEKKHVSSEAGLRLIAEGRRTAYHGSALTSHMLAFSRQQPMVTEEVDLNGLINEMLDMLKRTLGSQIRIDTRCSTNLWRAKVDRNQIEIAVLNLAINARDAMPLGGTLTLVTDNTTVDSNVTSIAPGKYVVLRVSDTGNGMEPKVLAQAVEPFYTTKEPGKGTGLGLSLVYGVARQLGGDLFIESVVGVGTTVSIYLPMVAPVEPATLAPDALGNARATLPPVPLVH